MNRTSGVRDMMNVLAYADGTRDLIELATTIGVPPWETARLAELLAAHALLEPVEDAGQAGASDSRGRG